MRIGIVHTENSPCRCAEAIGDGLASLGHEFLVYTSEEIELKAREIAQVCDLVFDHSDTFLGRGSLRYAVRALLETWGARIIGSNSNACRLADNKAAARIHLARMGILVPPGIVITERNRDIPSWLRPPFVLKAAFEHMSRGVIFTETMEETRIWTEILLECFMQPLIVETFIPGVELAVSVVETPRGVEMLPPLEWLPAGNEPIQDEAFKLVEWGENRRDARPACLTVKEERLLADYAALAFKSLGMSDYARFDIRYSPGGAFFFLEANTTPSLEPAEAIALSAKWAGLTYGDLLQSIIASALRRHGDGIHQEAKAISVHLPGGTVSVKIPQGVHTLYDSSIRLAQILDIKQGEKVIDLGCGSGFLSIAAARLGAGRVAAIDIDPGTMDAAQANIRINGLDGTIETICGSWYEPIGKERFNVIIATPPQTPGPRMFGPRCGGPEGTEHIMTVIDGAPSHLTPADGRLWLVVISLANVPVILERLHDLFEEVTIADETKRPFRPGEYEAMEKGLFNYLLRLRSEGISCFDETGADTYSFRTLYIRASKPRPT